MVICLFGLSSMLIDMRVDTECTPSIPGYEKIPEPGLPLDLILEPNLEILPLYLWFLFHNNLLKNLTEFQCLFYTSGEYRRPYHTRPAR